MFNECTEWKNVPCNAKPDTKTFVDFLIKSRADTTCRKYLAEIRKFLTWSVTNFSKITIPIPVSTAAIYLYKRHDESKSYANVVASHAALKWLHTFVPYKIENPLDTPICRNILETAKRMKLQPLNKKAPVTAEIIQKIIAKHAHPHTDLKNLRIACICSIGFAGFFRYSELVNITINHIHYEHDHVRIFVPSAKNDIYREGNYVYIKKLGSKYCPVDVLRRYTEAANANNEPDLPIFRPLRFFRSSNVFKLYGTRLSYTRCRELFKECLTELGYNAKNYGLHSLRSGGATAAANNGSVAERILKIHGRWKTDIAKDMYVHDSIKNRLDVTECLGL